MPRNLRGVAIGNHEGRNVLHDLGAAAEDGMLADAAKLMHAAQAADDRVVFDDNVTREGAVVREDDMVAHDAIVGDMRVGEKVAMAADDAVLVPGKVPRLTVQNSRKLLWSPISR